MPKHQSKIEKLIAELCPEGVEYCELKKVSLLTANIKWSDVDGEVFRYIDLTSVDRTTHTITETQSITSENAPSRAQQIVREGDVIFGTTRPMLKRYTLIPAEYDGSICSTGYCVLRPNKDRLLPNFIFHLLGIESFYTHVETNERGASYPAITDSAVKAFLIPIPPLAIQQEIVKILDTFSTLETELETELEAELEARKKQYEYYRDELLTFGDDVEWKTLNEIGNISMCKRIFKNETLTIGDIPFYKIGTFGKQPNAFIPQELFDEYRRKYSFPKKGDVLLSASGTIGRRVIYNGEPAYFQDSNIIWIDNDETKVLNKFLYYLYEIIEWKTEGGTIQRLYNDNLKKIKIPIPPLAEQERIVAILDKFDALVNGTTPSPDGATPPGEGNFQTQKLSDGTPGTAPPGEGNFFASLPAEISLRRKQYEYYRNKLLTFNQFPSTGGVAAKG
jgi:type I restriction enzyme, S subunit